MPPYYQITGSRRQDLHLLPAIELAAAVLLNGHAPASVLSETTSEREFRAAERAGRLWVALIGDTPVGFSQAEVLSSHEAHLKEIDVHPAHEQRGLGTRLVAGVCGWAARSGYPAVTLTRFATFHGTCLFTPALDSKPFPLANGARSFYKSLGTKPAEASILSAGLS